MRKIILFLAVIALANCQSGIPSGLLDCALSLRGLVNEAKNFYNKLSTSTSDGDLLLEYTILSGKIMGTLRDCNLNVSIQIMPANPQNCLNDIKSIASQVEKAIAAQKAGNYPELLEDVIALIQDVQQAIPDCTGKNITLTNINITKCAMDAERFYKDVADIAEDLKDGKINYTLFLNRSMDILSEIPNSLENCGLPQYADKFGNLTDTLNSPTCKSDISKSVGFVENAKKAYDAQDYVQLVHELSGLYLRAKSISANCLNLEVTHFLTSTLNLAQRLYSKDISNLQARSEAFILLKKFDKLDVPRKFLDQTPSLPAGCIEAVLALVPEAETLLKDIEAKNIVAVIEQLPTVAKLLSALVANCK